MKRKKKEQSFEYDKLISTSRNEKKRNLKWISLKGGMEWIDLIRHPQTLEAKLQHKTYDNAWKNNKQSIIGFDWTDPGKERVLFENESRLDYENN